MTLRRPEDAERLPLREPLSRYRKKYGCGGPDCVCCTIPEEKGGARIRRGRGHGKHRTLRDYRKGR